MSIMSFTPLKNDSFLRACLGEATEFTPVWLMRQAGRYLSEYRATRARAGSFLGLAMNVDYATEVTLQPLERFPLDAAILFSDILTVPAAMGLGLSFEEGEGPRFARPLRDEGAIGKLVAPDLEQLRYVFDAVASVRRELHGRVPLIGFAGSPWTLACYMVEGGSSTDYHQIKSLLYARPDLLRHILSVNADSVAQYLNAQIDAGAQAVMLFDSWGGVLADGAFQTFSLAYSARVFAQLKRIGPDGQVVPRIIFTKGGGLWLADMSALACDVIGVDWTVNLAAARDSLACALRQKSEAAGASGVDRQATPVALQGNLDPAILFAPPDAIRREARRVLDDFAAAPRVQATRQPTHVFNLGHGVNRLTPPEHVACLVDEVHAWSRHLRAP
jgi:uroporphyrinogen decarboxylase